jgi:hypothetical protein
MVAPACDIPDQPIDLDAVAERILQLAAYAAAEHMESLLASQAGGLLALAEELEEEDAA